jgi:hypothetical protein
MISQRLTSGIWGFFILWWHCPACLLASVLSKTCSSYEMLKIERNPTSTSKV